MIKSPRIGSFLRGRIPLATAAISLLLAGMALAQIHVINVSLDGLQEVPPVVTPGSGTATVTLDDVTGAVTVNGSYTNLVGNQTFAHIHGPAPAGVIGPQMVTLAGTGGMNGAFTGNGILTAVQITQMLNNLTYLNVHSDAFGGEVRGQILFPPPIPTLPLWGMILMGALLVAGGTRMVVRRSRAPSTA